MSRTKKLINYAHLNDQRGDVSKCWFVEYSFRLPGSDTIYRRRLYDGLGTGTAEQRLIIAKQLIEKVNEYLKSGEYLKHDADYSPVHSSDGYRPEQQRYNEYVEDLKVGRLAPKFLTYKHASIGKKTFQDYTSKLNEYAWFVRTKQDDPIVSDIDQPDICAFLQYLATDRGLCRRTIEKYEQVVRMFYDYTETIRARRPHSNPVYSIPNFGRVIDCSPAPYSTNDRERLKRTIQTREPYLWLACEMIYYCAIRPGTELRLLRIKHINREAKVVTIPAELAKNNRTESVVLPDILLEQMEQLNVFSYDRELYLFGKNGAPSAVPMGKNTMRNRFNSYRELLGISRDHKFYSWKHTGALSALENGVSTIELRDHLRHKSLETTENYIRKWSPRNDTSEKYIQKI